MPDSTEYLSSNNSLTFGNSDRARREVGEASESVPVAGNYVIAED